MGASEELKKDQTKKSNTEIDHLQLQTRIEILWEKKATRKKDAEEW